LTGNKVAAFASSVNAGQPIKNAKLKIKKQAAQDS
jgi:hypothetical protein